MTEEERVKWLNQPPTRAEVADLLAQLGVVTSSIANALASSMAEDRMTTATAMREAIADSRKYGDLLRKFIGVGDE